MNENEQWCTQASLGGEDIIIWSLDNQVESQEKSLEWFKGFWDTV
jgi:hypothetical protein